MQRESNIMYKRQGFISLPLAFIFLPHQDLSLPQQGLSLSTNHIGICHILLNHQSLLYVCFYIVFNHFLCLLGALHDGGHSADEAASTSTTREISKVAFDDNYKEYLKLQHQTNAANEIMTQQNDNCPLLHSVDLNAN